jgi:hypothetical protein
MGLGQGFTAGGSELDQTRGDQLCGRDDLHVAELPHVVVPAVQRAPADEYVGGALHHPLAVDHPRAVMVMAAGPVRCLIDGRSRLLGLEEQWVSTAAALQEHQVDPHAHAAYSDDLANHIDGGKPVEQAPPVLLEGQPVPGQEVIDDVGLLVVAERDADRGLLGDPGTPVRHRRQPGERSAAGAGLPLLLDVDRDAPAVGRLEIADQVVGVNAVVPDVELGHHHVPAHAGAIGLDAGRYRGNGRRLLDPVLPGRYHKTGGEALDIPLEGARRGFVEVAQVERQVPLRCGPQAEVQHVGVAAQLHRQAAVGLGGEVAAHDRGGAPVVVPRRGRHALMPERDEFGNPGLVLVLDRLQPVPPALFFVPVSQRAPSSTFPGGLARCSPLVARGPQIMQSSGRRRWSRRAGPGHAALDPDDADGDGQLGLAASRS